ncbi:protein kinase C-binding protein NELL2a-like [Haliotis asinina]|uniref:protein kinase C-binding protein NELL2a-like n=1 Tax=Haliotis asinina TaxID=109174 RepID=UPI003531B10B
MTIRFGLRLLRKNTSGAQIENYLTTAGLPGLRYSWYTKITLQLIYQDYTEADYDECSTPGLCHVNANCTNTHGSYTCHCNDRYEGDGVNCIPVTIKGEICTQASDCIRDNFICASGLCDCDVGYSYNSTSNTCVTRCDIYGTEFSHQSTTYCVSGYNNAIYSVNTYSACRNYCLAITSFTCRTFELWNGACYLSEVVKTEVPDSKWAAWSGCKYYQRHCA